MLKLAILISGRGSNLEAIQENIENGILKNKAEIRIVISNKAEAKGLDFAEKHGLQTVVCSTETEVLAELGKREIDLICLAGYMRIVSPEFVRKYPHKIINIHPTLLPKYPGLHVHEKVIAARETESGCTVHYVDEGVDTGEIIRQLRVPVLPEDTPDTLAARVLAQEPVLYSEVILNFCE
jgi:phosphoribosylglycinamide formyltransferase-1